MTFCVCVHSVKVFGTKNVPVHGQLYNEINHYIDILKMIGKPEKKKTLLNLFLASLYFYFTFACMCVNY